MKLKVTTAANQRPALWIYGVIGEIYGGISPLDVRDALTEIPDQQDIDVRIHSDGGSFPDSIAINSLIARRKGAAHSIIDGKAYSGASVIAMSGKTISMQPGSWMMLHEARGGLDGTAAEHREAAERLEAINDQLVAIYKPRWKGTEKELRSALNAETWLRDSDAVNFGLADSVDGEMAIAAYVDPEKFGYRNVPEAVLLSKAPGLSAAEEILNELFAA